MTRQYLVADLFCGAGGSSTGAERAVKSLGAAMILTCVNHWPLAIETHKANHPTARHYIEDISKAKPRDLVPEGYLDLLMASPECTHFSRARGGKPVNDQSRMNPWAVISWLTELDVRCLLVENVPEFVQRGPIGNGIPDAIMRGMFFEAWTGAIKKLGYRLEYRFLNAADYGDATTRKRFFLIARKDRQRIRFPKPTHSKDGGNGLKKWRAAREIIDWDKPGRSLLDDPKYLKRPLSINTRRRIARGLEKYGGAYAPMYIRLLGIEETPSPLSPNHVVEGFTFPNRNHATPRGMGEPVNTICASNGGGGLCRVEPMAVPFVLGQQSCAAARGADNPLPTVATAGAISLVEPQIVVFHGKSTTQKIEQPLPSQPTHSKAGLVEPQLVSYYSNTQHSCSIEMPAPTITTKDRLGLVEPTAEPFIMQTRIGKPGDHRPHGLDEPTITCTGHGAGALVEPVAEPFLVDRNHPDECDRTRSVDEPMNTITTHHTRATVIEPVFKNADGFNIDPLRLVTIDGRPYVLDIRFRMLNNRELARAMGFDDAETEYEFMGTVVEVTKQIGNAVPVNLAEALVKTILEDK